MKREIIQLFVEWKNRETRKPLIVRGARQVGKTYTIHEFANLQFANSVTINLEESPELRGIFKTNNPKNIVQELSVIKNTDITPGQTLNLAFYRRNSIVSGGNCMFALFLRTNASVTCNCSRLTPRSYTQ